MEELCAICQDHMTVPEYDIERLGEIIIEKDCTRLKCGHALHSKCMIEGLQSYNGKCLVCNVTGVDKTHLSFDDRIKFEARCLRVLGQLKRHNSDVKNAVLDCNAFRTEYKQKVKEYNHKIKEFCKNLEKEMNISKYRSDYLKTRSVCISTLKKNVGKDTIYGAALSRINHWKLERWLCGRQVYMSNTYRFVRRFR